MPSSVNPYQSRMLDVLEYVDHHLECELTVDTLAGVAAFSKFHFQRQFSALFGISVHRYIQLKRFKRSSYTLAFRRKETVLQVSQISGYKSPEAFARSFRQIISQSPSEFKENPDWGAWQLAITPINNLRNQHMIKLYSLADVELIEFPSTRVAIKTHVGNPALLGDTIREFIAWRRTFRLSPKVSATFNIFYSAPEDDLTHEFRLDLCAATSQPVQENLQNVVAGEIPMGRCAKLRTIGTSDNLGPTIDYLYREWLPDSGYELRDFPVFAQRVSMFPDVPEHEAITDIFLPLV